MADQSTDSFKMQERIKAERSSSGPHNVPSRSQNGKSFSRSEWMAKKVCPRKTPQLWWLWWFSIKVPPLLVSSSIFQRQHCCRWWWKSVRGNALNLFAQMIKWILPPGLDDFFSTNSCMIETIKGKKCEYFTCWTLARLACLCETPSTATAEKKV